MIESINTFGKFLDQPILISKMEKYMPAIVSAGAIGYLAHDTFQKSKKEGSLTKDDKKDLTQKAIVAAASVIGAFAAPKIASKLTGRVNLDSIEKIKKDNVKLIDNFKKDNKISDEIKGILDKAKDKVLSFKEIKLLFKQAKNQNYKDLLSKLIPDPENINSDDIFKEIGYLSIYGAVPVVSGIAGGIAADALTEPDKVKEKIPNKINEGMFQYLANIFMCNVGAGAALAVLEKAGITSKSARAIGMMAGIALTGVIGGAKIANTISNKIINPFLPKDKKIKERKTEAMDLCMHTDDIATVSMLSGLKWIEPSLPILYAISGYKAGVGYTNNK